MTHPDRPDLVYLPFFEEWTKNKITGKFRKLDHEKAEDRRVHLNPKTEIEIRPGWGYVVCLGADGPDLHTTEPTVACRWAWNHARRLNRTIPVVLDDRRTLCDFVPPEPGDAILLPTLTPSAGSLWPA